MAEEVPTGDKAVYLFIEMIALGFVLYSVEEAFKDNPSWAKVAISLLMGILFFALGVKWVSIKSKLWPGISARIDRVVSDFRVRYGVALLVGAAVVISVFISIRGLRKDIDTYVMPRTITKEQSDKILATIRNRAPEIPIYIVASSSDREAINYASQIRLELTNAGWNAKLFPINPWDENQHDPKIGLVLTKIQLVLNPGVSILVCEIGSPQNQDPRHPRPDAILREALGEIVDGGGVAAGCGIYSVSIAVGQRPLASPLSVKRQFRNWLMRATMGWQ